MSRLEDIFPRVRQMDVDLFYSKHPQPLNKEFSMSKVIWILVVAMLAVIFPVVLFADDGTGTVGSEIVRMLTTLFNDNSMALTIYTAIVSIIGICARVLLKKVPVVARGIVGMFFWKIAAILFGDGVLLENNKNTEYVRDELKKKYPLLSIKIGDEK
jgi:hypothetical protein